MYQDSYHYLFPVKVFQSWQAYVTGFHHHDRDRSTVNLKTTIRLIDQTKKAPDIPTSPIESTTFSVVRQCHICQFRVMIRELQLKGEGGVPWVQIMENELECLGDRTGHDGHLTKKFLKKDYS